MTGAWTIGGRHIWIEKLPNRKSISLIVEEKPARGKVVAYFCDEDSARLFSNILDGKDTSENREGNKYV